MAHSWNPATADVLMVAGDIGGTNSRFALYHKSTDELMKQKCLFRESYKNDTAENFLSLLLKFVDAAENACPSIAVKSSIASCCLAVAGPVSKNVATLTNISYVINGQEISHALNIPEVRVINDFVANGYGILTLSEDEKIKIHENQCQPEEGAPKFCIGAGTGLGECYLTPLPNGSYEAWASEGGHVEYAPRTPLQTELLAWLQKKFNGRISMERVVSGKGLVNVYEFLADRHPEKVDEAKHKQIMSETEGAKFISEYSYDYQLCKEAIDIMLDAYGSEVGNGGLKFLPYGGIYIAGGIAPIHREKIKDRNKSSFLEAMNDKGRLSSVLDRIPVWIVESSDLGLRGAHYVAFEAVKSIQVAAPSLKEKKEPVPEPVPTVNQKWGWVEDAVYVSGIIAISLMTLVGFHSVATKLRAQ